MNTDSPWPTLEEAQARASRLSRTDGQLTQSSVSRFLQPVCDPALLTAGLARVRGHWGARSAGVEPYLESCHDPGSEPKNS